MKRYIKTKEQLLNELSMLSRRVADMEESVRLFDLLKERYSMLSEGCIDGYVVIDKKGFIQEHNSAFGKMLGYANAELKDKTYKELSPEKWQSIEEKIIREQVLKRNYSNIYEKEYRRKDGSIIPVEARTYLIKDIKGKYNGLMVFIRDMSCVKQIENKLSISQESFYKTFRSNPTPISLSRIDGAYIDVNDSASRLFGYSRKELIGRTADDINLWCDQNARNIIVSKLLNKDIVHDEFVELRTKSGEVKSILLSSEMVNINGEDLILSLSYDITERKKAEEDLRESERRFFDIIDFLPLATLVIDIQGKVIAWNRAIEDMTGIEKKTILGKGDYEYALPFYGTRRPMLADLVLKPNKKIEREFETIMRDGDYFLVAETWVTIKGRKVCVWGKAGPFYDSKGNIVGAIESLKDITNEKQYQDNIKERELELKDMNAALRVLLNQRVNDQKELGKKILTNVKVLVLPYLEKLKTQYCQNDAKRHFNILESTLKEIISPFVQNISAVYPDLTNREIQVANLIKEEKTSKDIAKFLNISESAVNMHRYRVRQKLNIKKSVNLRAFLSSLS